MKLIFFKARFWSKETDNFHRNLSAVSNHMYRTLLEQDSCPGLHLFDYPVDVDFAFAFDDIDKFLTFRMRNEPEKP